jgi:hypothetical protein
LVTSESGAEIKVLKCGAGEEWRKSVGLIELEIKEIQGGEKYPTYK